MRLALTQLEELPPTAFVLFAGATWGVLQTFPSFFGGPWHLGGVLFITLIVYGGGFLLCWAAIRRRRFSVWRTAWHSMLALDLAHVIGFAFSTATFHAEIRAPWLTVLEGLVNTVLWMSPIRFAASAIVLAVGRLLPGSGRPLAWQPLVPADHESVTKEDR